MPLHNLNDKGNWLLLWVAKVLESPAFLNDNPLKSCLESLQIL